MKRIEVPCGERSALEEAERTLAENAEFAKRMEAFGALSKVNLKISDWRYPGGASLEIWIPGVRQRDAGERYMVLRSSVSANQLAGFAL